MASFEVDFPEDFLKDLLDTEFDEIAKEALEKASPILEEEMKKACSRVIEHEGDSELVDSIKACEPVRAKTDAWIVSVIPKGYSKVKTYLRGEKKKRRYAVSNALKAVWKEYGVAGKQAPKPFITTATNSAKGNVMTKLQEVYNEKVGGT